MKKLFIMMLLMIVTTVVFSMSVDRPPDINNVKIENTNDNNFIFPVVITEPILTVAETLYQTNEMPTILALHENKGDVQKGKATPIHLKNSGTENLYGTANINYSNKSKIAHCISGMPRIRSPELKANLL